MTPEKFAEILCHDLDLTTQHVRQVAASIKAQLQEYRRFQDYLAPTPSCDLIPIQVVIVTIIAYFDMKRNR
jgi:hypothetical protein